LHIIISQRLGGYRWTKFLSVYLYQKNIGSRKLYRYKFSGKQACSSEGALGLATCQVPGTLGLALTRPGRDWAWQCVKPRAHPKECTFSFGHAKENDHPPLACPMEWGNVGLANMSDPRYLDLVFSQVQGNVSLVNM